MKNPAPLLKFEKVAFLFDQRQIFSSLDLQLQPGELLCVLGPSGCGKTTLLQLAAGFIYPQGGSIFYRGEPLRMPDPDRLMVLQDTGQLFPWLTAAGNICLGLKAAASRNSLRTRSPGPTRKNRQAEHHLQAVAALEEVGLAAEADSYPHHLSGGMKQRVALARAFAVQPGLLLLDEPFSAVDALQRSELQQLLRRLMTKHGGTALFVTHDIDEALILADRLLVMSRQGAIIHELSFTAPATDSNKRMQEISRLKIRLLGALQEASADILP